MFNLTPTARVLGWWRQAGVLLIVLVNSVVGFATVNSSGLQAKATNLAMIFVASSVEIFKVNQQNNCAVIPHDKAVVSGRYNFLRESCCISGLVPGLNYGARGNVARRMYSREEIGSSFGFKIFSKANLAAYQESDRRRFSEVCIIDFPQDSFSDSNFWGSHTADPKIRSLITDEVCSRKICRSAHFLQHSIGNTGINYYGNQCQARNHERPYIYPIGLLGAWILIVIGGWHLKLPARGGHQPKSWSDVYMRIAIGIFCVLLGVGVIPLTFWLAGFF